jgi:general stress protein CsbA
MPLGAEWAIMFVMTFICFTAYTATRNYVATVLVGALLSAAFIQLYPPIYWTLILPLQVALGIAVVFYLIYKTRNRPLKGIKYNEGVSDDG